MKSLAALLTASLLAATASAADAPAAPKVDLAKGGASYAAVCVACHAADGNSTVPLQPKLAQQHPEYLVKQMLEFKSGSAPRTWQGRPRPANSAAPSRRPAPRSPVPAR